jgi:hypothetical protein
VTCTIGTRPRFGRAGVLQLAWHDNNKLLRLCGVSPTGVMGSDIAKDGSAMAYLAQVSRDAANGMADELGQNRLPWSRRCSRPARRRRCWARTATRSSPDHRRREGSGAAYPPCSHIRTFMPGMRVSGLSRVCQRALESRRRGGAV